MRLFFGIINYRTRPVYFTRRFTHDVRPSEFSALLLHVAPYNIGGGRPDFSLGREHKRRPRRAFSRCARAAGNEENKSMRNKVHGTGGKKKRKRNDSPPEDSLPVPLALVLSSRARYL